MPMQQMFLGLGAAEKFAEATGGTVTTVGDYKIHAFTSSGTFTVTQLADTNEFECLLVSGGASGAVYATTGSGGGGGIVNHQTGQALTAAAYTITIGAGGSGVTYNVTPFANVLGNEGGTSSIKLASNGSTILEANVSVLTRHQSGNESANVGGGDSAKIINGTTTQYNGGYGYTQLSGAGGGAGSGEDGGPTQLNYISGVWHVEGGTGGDGLAVSITGSSTNYGGGGGASSGTHSYASAGGAGGGGTGASWSGTSPTAGSANTGGGGGGGTGTYPNRASLARPSANGGSGVVYIKYKYQ